MVFWVEEWHIADGRVRSPEGCAVALAIADRVRDCSCIHVEFTRISVDEKEYKVPPELADWIRRFDMGEQVDSIRVSLEEKIHTTRKVDLGIRDSGTLPRKTDELAVV